MLKEDAKPPPGPRVSITWSQTAARRHHWQAIHRGAFYRGGPIKTAISSG
jgi:hypothetical protein